MKYAIFSDIHGNLEALQKALEAARTNKAEELIVLGDMVGYGPNPNECIDLCRENASVILMGNHDKAAIVAEEAECFNQYAARAVQWTAQQLTGDSSKFLSSLPLLEIKDRILFVHASPYQPEEWHYITTRKEADLGFSVLSQDICFVGHSHIPVIFGTQSEIRDSNNPVTLNDNERYIINVGSIGQPRDHDSRLSFGLYDDAANEFQWIRTEYNRERTAEKILSAGLPSFLAERLFNGV